MGEDPAECVCVKGGVVVVDVRDGWCIDLACDRQGTVLD